MSDFFPLIVDASGTPAIKEIPSGDVLDLTGVTVKAVSVDTTLAVAGASTLTGNTTVGGTLGVTGAITGSLTGNVTGNVSGTAATVTGAAQSSITSLGTLTGLTLTGVLTGTSLDISGDIDVDGTTNLDVVDIDGAVDMASTLDLAGKLSLGTSNGDADYESGYLVIEIGGSGNIAGKEASNEELFLSGNAYYNSGWKYSNAGAAGLVDIQNGRIRIRNAGDGSDGGAITWITSLDIQQAGDVNVAKSARITQGALTSSSNAVAWDAKAICNAYHVTTENTTFSAPSNAVEGAIISVELAQGGTVRTIAWNTVFEFAASTAPTVTATANKTDIFSFRYNGSVWQEIGRVQNLAQT